MTLTKKKNYTHKQRPLPNDERPFKDSNGHETYFYGFQVVQLQTMPVPLLRKSEYIYYFTFVKSYVTFYIVKSPIKIRTTVRIAIF